MLDDAAAKGILDVSNAVRHTNISEEQMREMMGEGGTISSKAGDDVNTEHYEFPHHPQED